MVTKHKFWFNTGVQPWKHKNYHYPDGGVLKNGTVQIPYYLEYAPPKGFTVSHLCDKPQPGELAIPIVGGNMLSKFAIFKGFTNG